MVQGRDIPWRDTYKYLLLTNLEEDRALPLTQWSTGENFNVPPLGSAYRVESL